MLPHNCLEMYRMCTGQAITDANSPYSAAYDGELSYWVRDPSDAEDYLLKKALLDPRLEGRWFSRLCGDQFNRFKTWPMFFDSEESSGTDLRGGFAIIWSTFIIAETLLAALAIQPFLAALPLKGWKFKVYGMLWSGALVSNLVGLSVTTMFLAFLHSVPAKLSFMWVCNIGAWIAVPIALLILSALTTSIAICYSAWVIYGKIVRIVCVIGGLLSVWFSVTAANSLQNACVATQNLLRRPESEPQRV